MSTRVHSFLCIEGKNQARGARILHLYLNMSFLAKFRIPYLCPPLAQGLGKMIKINLKLSHLKKIITSRGITYFVAPVKHVYLFNSTDKFSVKKSISSR